MSHKARDARFSDEEWLTPMQIARKLGYATDKPVRNAIKRGELKASYAPCRRKLIVCWLTDIVMCATPPYFPSLRSIQVDIPLTAEVLPLTGA